LGEDNPLATQQTTRRLPGHHSRRPGPRCL